MLICIESIRGSCSSLYRCISRICTVNNICFLYCLYTVATAKQSRWFRRFGMDFHVLRRENEKIHSTPFPAPVKKMHFVRL
jgi:hypothetical protein